MKVHAIFDIGKSNKKFFLFDENYQEVHKDYISIKEIKDEDRDPCDNLQAIEKWIKNIFTKITENKKYNIQSINFSTYGASFVHIDKKGKPITPLYNYLKPYPEKLLISFYEKYGGELNFSRETASPPLGMLNSGLQLYWLKYAKPELFKKIHKSIHFPQYLSFLFTGVPVSGYTSIGCHTGLWDFVKNDYHDWVYAEHIDRILPTIVNTNTCINKRVEGKMLKIGVGIHDSSSALLPYIRAAREPFLLLSTGTWSIALNPFNHEPLTTDELKKDCLNFLSVDGKMVKASRLFLGNEYQTWVKRLAGHFNVNIEKHKSVKCDTSIINKLNNYPKKCFKWESINSENIINTKTDLNQFPNYEIAYHKLMQELVDLQIEKLLLAKGNTHIKKIFIDGGFINNELFIYFLKKAFPEIDFIIADNPLGSALGAAMVINEEFNEEPPN